MITVSFAKLEKSELAREAVMERIVPVIQKFPDSGNSRVRITLAMENSPLHPGPDMFAVNLHFRGGRYHNVRLKRMSPNLYHALAEIAQLLPDILNRFGDRVRVSERRSARRIATVSAAPKPHSPLDDLDDDYPVEYYDRP